MWTDGSQNTETNFADNPGLEGEQCCVKTGKRGWRGEECSALLHGVCQYHVENYISAPQHLVAEPQENGIIVTWSHGDDGWVASSNTVTCCFVRALDEDAQKAESDYECVEKEVDSGTYQLFIGDLDSFSEYEITVRVWLNFFNVSKSSSFFGRTCKYLLYQGSV